MFDQVICYIRFLNIDPIFRLQGKARFWFWYQKPVWEDRREKEALVYRLVWLLHKAKPQAFFISNAGNNFQVYVLDLGFKELV